MDDSALLSPRLTGESAGGHAGGASGKARKRSTRRPKRLAPLEEGQTQQLRHSQTTKSGFITIKKDLVEAVRRIAPASIEPSPIIFRDIQMELKTTTLDSDNVKQQLNIVEDGVNNSARKYNDLRVLCERKKFELKGKLDALETQRLQYDELCRMKKANTFESARIDVLKKELGVVTDDLQRIDHQRRQLLHMLQRLNKNQILFDAHMNGMTDCYNAVYKEYTEVVLLRRGLDAGLAKTQSVYEITLNRVNEARNERAITLAQRKGELKNAHRLKAWLKERVAQKIALSNGLRGDLTREEESFLKIQMREKEEKTRQLQRSNEENQRRAQVLEKAFMRIKQLIGVATFEEIVEKFHMQRVNKQNIEREVREVEQRLSLLKAENSRQEQHYRDLKSSGSLGSAGDVVTRDMTIQLNDEINQAKNEYKLWRAELARLNSILVSLQQGGAGLHQRTKPFMHLIDGVLNSANQSTEQRSGGVFELTSSQVLDHSDHKSVNSIGPPGAASVGSGSGAGAVSPSNQAIAASAVSRPGTAEGLDAAMPEGVWRETMDSLSTAEHILSRMLEIVSQPGASPGAPFDSSPSKGATGTFIGSTFDGYAASFNAKGGYTDYNLRDSRNLRNTEMWSDLNADGAVIANNLRVASKRNLKALEILQISGAPGDANNSSGAKQGPSAVETATTDDSLDESVSPGAKEEGKGAGLSPRDGGQVGGVGAALVVPSAEDLMTRLGVKSLSVNTTQEHNRMMLAEARARKLAERMKAGSGVPGQESALDVAARVKAQQDAAVRLCVFRHPPTLPKGSTLRDPPLVKTEAFLTKMPDLT